MKRLIVCCDGTWNHLEMACPTNVVKIAKAIKPVAEDGTAQILYYDEGVGTETGNTLTNFSEKFLGGGMGIGLEHNIKQAYRFLANNYEDGDQIYLFGFSRGSYTVRALAGMINFAGLLARHQITEIAEAHDLYRAAKKANSPEAKKFRNKHNSEPVPIHCLGCWDTVGALGIPDKLPFIGIDKSFNKKFRFVDTKLNKWVKNAFHALAINEERKEFTHTLMQKAHGASQNLEQVWFAGDHGSIGGGSEFKQPLSNIALQWMMDKVSGIGLDLHAEQSNPLPQDAFAYFKPEENIIYSTKKRDVPKNSVFHESAIQRFVDVPIFRQSLIKSAKDQLQAKSNGFVSHVHQTSSSLTLAPGQFAITLVHAQNLMNNSKIKLVKGGKYELSVPNYLYWLDGGIFCKADGWNVEQEAVQSQLDGMTGAAKKNIIKLGKKQRVLPDNNWFMLGVCLGSSYKKEPCYAIGFNNTLTANKDCTLHTFANDFDTFLYDMYGNNKGWLPLTVKRVS